MLQKYQDGDSCAVFAEEGDRDRFLASVPKEKVLEIDAENDSVVLRGVSCLEICSELDIEAMCGDWDPEKEDWE